MQGKGSGMQCRWLDDDDDDDDEKEALMGLGIFNLASLGFLDFDFLLRHGTSPCSLILMQCSLKHREHREQISVLSIPSNDIPYEHCSKLKDSIVIGLAFTVAYTNFAMGKKPYIFKENFSDLLYMYII